MADSIEDEVTYLQSLGVTAEDLDTLNTDIRHTEFAIAQSVFSGISEDIEFDKYSKNLIYGVTGSRKN